MENRNGRLDRKYMDSEILHQMTALGIGQRKLSRELTEMKSAQKNIAAGQDQMIEGLDRLHAMQRELLLLMKALASKSNALEETDKEEWLNPAKVMDLLFITKSTFYRRRDTEKWVRKRNGRSWLYLKRSVLGTDG